jgi:hypothetical protein
MCRLIPPVNDVERIKDVLTVIHHVEVLSAVFAGFGLEHQRTELRQFFGAHAFQDSNSMSKIVVRDNASSRSPPSSVGQFQGSDEPAAAVGLGA